MSESKLPREPVRSPEAFVVHESATGKSFPIRECSDAQLAANLQDARNQAQAVMQQALQLIGQSMTISKAEAVIAYEIERRAKSLQLVTDLSAVHGLRRQ